METRISATELVRSLGDVLGRIRYRGETFIVERSGTAVARIGPAAGASRLKDAMTAWRAATADPTFADDLARVNRADHVPTNPWA